MRNLLLLLLVLVCGTATAQKPLPEKDQARIESIMDRQSVDWNSGNIEGFMNGYWESDELKFVGKSGVTTGWQSTLDRYKNSYPDRRAMGTLTFSKLQMQKIAGKTALVIGRWQLSREEGDLEGWFSLIWKKIKGEWVIVADHSS